MVELSFLGQSTSDESTLGAFLERVLNHTEIDSLTVVVAWARFRGLVRVRPEIEAFRARGGTTRLIVGIDEGGATRPGLLIATELFDQAHVFHDPGGGTFHPKIYLAEGAEQALLVVGSSNATPGGWFGNYEASLEARFALPGATTHPALQGVREYIEAIHAESELCFELNEELVDRLVENPRYKVAGHERSRRNEVEPSNEESHPANVLGSTNDPDGTQPLFGSRVARRIAVPPLSVEQKRELASLEILPEDEAESDVELRGPRGEISRSETSRSDRNPRRALEPTDVARSEPPPDETPVEVWTKELSQTDAQQRPQPTKPTGNVRLVKSGHVIDSRTWFREVLFGSAAWRREADIHNKPIDRADIPFSIEIDGEARGTMELQVTDAQHRQSDQHNHTTVLRWGALLPILRATDYTGYRLTLARMSDDSFRLDIAR